MTIVELFKLRVSVHGFSHFTFHHSWIGYLVLMVQGYFQSSLEISIEIDSLFFTFFLIFQYITNFDYSFKTNYGYVQIEGRRRFRNLRSWDQDG